MGLGFSNIFPIPSYQASAVANYFAEHNPPYPYYSTVNNISIGANGGIYNRNGRGYPDGTSTLPSFKHFLPSPELTNTFLV